jgi:SARP family transcriptional regulator, regulator of embCAB operon
MLRVYLSGQIAVDGPGGRLKGSSLPGRQGREVLCILVIHRGRPVSRTELATALWGDGWPASWETALSSILSKLRGLLSGVGLERSDTLTSADGCHALYLPPTAWVDHEVAFNSIHEAETSLKQGDFRSAYGPSAVAWAISARPFLPGSDAPWIEARRQKLKNTLVRALEARSTIYRLNGEPSPAAEAAREAIATQPFRESAYRCLMRAHAAAGNAAEALAVYERCRALISEQFGVPPSRETKETHRSIIKGL